MHVRRWEAMVVLRLPDSMIRRLMKFHGVQGRIVESELDVAGMHSAATRLGLAGNTKSERLRRCRIGIRIVIAPSRMADAQETEKLAAVHRELYACPAVAIEI